VPRGRKGKEYIKDIEEIKNIGKKKEKTAGIEIGNSPPVVTEKKVLTLPSTSGNEIPYGRDRRVGQEGNTAPQGALILKLR